MSCCKKYVINGYRIQSDLTVKLTHNVNDVSFTKALYFAKLWQEQCERIEITEEFWQQRIDGKV